MEEKRLTLARTKAYVKEILDMSAEDALKLLKDQVTTKLLLIGDQTLKLMEQMDVLQPDQWRERAALSASIEMLTKCATEITSSKIALDKALGIDLLPLIPETAPTIGEAEGEISEAEFVEEYLREANKTKTLPVKPAEV